MKRMIFPFVLLAALAGCGDNSNQGPEKREFKVKAAPKDDSEEKLKQQLAEEKKHSEELEARLNKYADLLDEVKQKQDQTDEMLSLYETAKKKPSTDNPK